METTTTTTATTTPRPPPSSQTPPCTVGFSPLEFVLVLIAVIAIPVLIYTVFFINCPPHSSPRRRRSSGSFDSRSEDFKNAEIVSEVKYQKEFHVEDLGGECPVCLSVFADGEEITQLIACKHSFHTFCIDMWFKSHSNCPICRAFIPIRTNSRLQGLPDTASLV